MKLQGWSHLTHVLLGNGWSTALFSTYGYGKLLEKAQDDLEPWIVNLVESVGGDFEVALEHIGARIQGDVFDGQGGLELPDDQDRFMEGETSLRSALIGAIHEVNSESNALLANNQLALALRSMYSGAWKFLKQFHNVFTLNYDLLLYYVLQQGLEDKSADGWKDGFSRKVPNRPIRQHRGSGTTKFLHHLHGALHLFSESDDGKIKTYKRVRQLSDTEDDQTPILEQVKQGIEGGQWPLFVAEGTPEAKRAKIADEPYLQQSLDCFRNVIGNLLVIGSSLGESDRHILDAIIDNKGLHSLTCTWYSQERRADLVSRMEWINEQRANQELPELPLYTIDVRHLPLWESTLPELRF